MINLLQKFFSPLVRLQVRAGFTILEMVVSVSIIAIMSSLFIANYHSSNKRTDLIMAAQGVTADIHLAQSNTLGLVKYNGDVPAGGWGVHFDINSNSYVVFADNNAPGEAGYTIYNAGSENNINYGARVTTFAPGIKIASLSIDGVEKNIANVTFLPPDPKTNITDETIFGDKLTILLQETIGNTVKEIRVNFLGLVEVVE